MDVVLQEGPERGWTAPVTLISLAVGLGATVASGAAPRLATQIDVRWTLAIGVALTGVGLDLMALFVSVDGGCLSILGGLLALGFGSGLAMTPSTEAITSSLPRKKQGVASSGLCGGVGMTAVPLPAKTASNAAVDLLSRSRMRNRKHPALSSRSMSRSRASWATQAPVGWAVTPRT
ncbi:hypothetical protein AB0H03_08840 [Streptomyces sparsogenes]